MSTTPGALYPNYYQPYYQQAGANNVGFQTGNNPVKATQNQRAVVQSQGDQYQLSDEELAQQQQQEQQGTQNYLNPIEEANASGQGGYTADQASQIELTPEQKQNIVTGAGISAGAGTASSVGAAERAADAAGGNPSALATYRARAVQTQAADAGQASTGASVAAQQAGSAGAQAVGNAQISQENQGQQYLSNLQAQQGGAAQNEQGLAQGAYGTETGGTGAATNSELSAAGIPTSTDKIIGAVAGAAGAAGLADGYPGYMDDGGQDAVVGENGMEAVIENAPKAVVKGASDPVRSNTKFMANGDYGGETNNPVDPATISSPAAPAATSNGMPGWLRSYLANAGKTTTPGTQSPGPVQPGWNKTTPYSQAGTAIGGIAKPFIQKAMAPTPAAPSGGSSSGGVDPSLIGGGPSQPVTPTNYLGDAPDIGMGGDAESGPMMADGDGGDGSGIVNDYLADSTAKSDGVTSGPPPSAPAQNPSMATATDIGKLAGTALSFLGNGKMGGGFHWSDPAPKMPITPRMQERSGYQPLAYKAKPMLADGAVAMPQPMAQDAPSGGPGQPVQPGNGMQVGNAKVFNKPTLIHLEKADMVVPLSYRAKAKVRPSAALPAMKTAPRRMYGAHAA